MGDAVKTIVNIVYHAVVLSALALGYTILGDRLFKIKSADLSRLNVEESAKLVGVITVSIATKDLLVQQGLLPENIN